MEGCRLSVSVHSNWDWSTLAYYFPLSRKEQAKPKPQLQQLRLKFATKSIDAVTCSSQAAVSREIVESYI